MRNNSNSSSTALRSPFSRRRRHKRADPPATKKAPLCKGGCRGEAVTGGLFYISVHNFGMTKPGVTIPPFATQTPPFTQGRLPAPGPPVTVPPPRSAVSGRLSFYFECRGAPLRGFLRRPGRRSPAFSCGRRVAKRRAGSECVPVARRAGP